MSCRIFFPGITGFPQAGQMAGGDAGGSDILLPQLLQNRVFAGSTFLQDGHFTVSAAGSGGPSFTMVRGDAGESMRSVFEDEDGRMWVGSQYGGIAVGMPGWWKVLTEKNGLAGYEVKTVVQDGTGTYWFATNNGLPRQTPVRLYLQVSDLSLDYC